MEAEPDDFSAACARLPVEADSGTVGEVDRTLGGAEVSDARPYEQVANPKWLYNLDSAESWNDEESAVAGLRTEKCGSIETGRPELVTQMPLLKSSVFTEYAVNNLMIFGWKSLFATIRKRGARI